MSKTKIQFEEAWDNVLHARAHLILDHSSPAAWGTRTPESGEVHRFFYIMVEKLGASGEMAARQLLRAMKECNCLEVFEKKNPESAQVLRKISLNDPSETVH